MGNQNWVCGRTYAATSLFTNKPLMIPSSPLQTIYSDETIMSSVTSQIGMNKPLMIASSPLQTIYADEKEKISNKPN